MWKITVSLFEDCCAAPLARDHELAAAGWQKGIIFGKMSKCRCKLIWVMGMLLAGISVAHAQVSGWVVDAEDGDSLAFAYLLNLNSQKGSFSGLDGRFVCTDAREGDSLRVSLLGYLPQTIAASAGKPLVIALQPGGVHLSDVEIRPTENPALRIMRNLVAHRDENNPRNLKDYYAESYNKLSAKPIYPGSVPDSSKIDFHIFLSETVTHRIQVGPENVHEEIVAARLAGYPGKVIPFTAADLQDLSLYDNYVSVFGQKFLSPVSPPGLHQYRFTLLDTVLAGSDSIFTIDFRPANGIFDGFEGEIRVHTRKWALLTAEARLVLHEPGILIESGQIRQVYEELSTGEWVPAELSSEMKSKSISNNSPIRFQFNGFSRLSHQTVGLNLQESSRSEDALNVAKGAGKEDSLLQAGRAKRLDSLELRSYYKLDSLGERFHLANVLDQTWKLGDGKLMLGPIDLLLERIWTNNRGEKTRLGIGLTTNENISRRFALSGFAGWGFADRQWKYGASAQLTPLGDDRIYAGFSWSHDLLESGFRRLGIRPERGLHQDIYRETGIRNWYLKNMEYVNSREFWVGVRLPTDLGLRFARRIEEVRSAYEYRYDGDTVFHFDEAEIAIRWAPGAHYATSSGRRLLLSNDAPVVLARYTQGLSTQYGDIPYRAIAFSLSYSFQAFRGGKAAIVLHAGGNDRSVPRSRMRVFRSNYDRRNLTELAGAFNTMRYDEFAADRYAEGFAYISPKLRWLRFGPRIQPKLYLSVAAAWGMLYARTNDLTQPTPMLAPSKVFIEPGIGLTHLLPAAKQDNFMSALIRGIGVGVYYRLGAYRLPKVLDNFAFRITFGIDGR